MIVWREVKTKGFGYGEVCGGGERCRKLECRGRL